MRVIMLGAPSADKGIQARKVAVKYQIPHIFTGDIFRADIKDGAELGAKAKPYMSAGDLVPDEATIGMLLDRIHKGDYENGYALGESSRTISQAESLIRALGDMGEATDYVVNVGVPDENIINRTPGRRACLSCGTTYRIVHSSSKKEGIYDVYGQQLVFRDDNKPEAVKKRLDVYHDQIQSLIKYYKEADVLAEAGGTLDIREVFQVIVRILGV